jgi:hypothetical protein
VATGLCSDDVRAAGVGLFTVQLCYGLLESAGLCFGFVALDGALLDCLFEEVESRLDTGLALLCGLETLFQCHEFIRVAGQLSDLCIESGKLLLDDWIRCNSVSNPVYAKGHVRTVDDGRLDIILGRHQKVRRHCQTDIREKTRRDFFVFTRLDASTFLSSSLFRPFVAMSQSHSLDFARQQYDSGAQSVSYSTQTSASTNSFDYASSSAARGEAPKRADVKKKLVVVGDGGCGKTCLLIVYSKNRFPEVRAPSLPSSQL